MFIFRAHNVKCYSLSFSSLFSLSLWLNMLKCLVSYSMANSFMILFLVCFGSSFSNTVLIKGLWEYYSMFPCKSFAICPWPLYLEASSLVSSVTQSCTTLYNPMNCSTPGLLVHHQLPEFIPTHVHWVGDAIQPSHPLSSPSPPAFNLSQHQDLFRWVSSSHQVAKVLEFQLQRQSYQWKPRTDLL